MPFFARKNKKESSLKSEAKKNIQANSTFGVGHEGVKYKSLLKSISQQDIEKGDLGGSLATEQTSSRLSKTFQEILHDRDSLPYFVQFLQSKHAEAYIKFWLDADSFLASSMTRVRSNSQMEQLKQPQSVESQHSVPSPQSQSTDEENLNSNNSAVCFPGRVDGPPKDSICDKSSSNSAGFCGVDVRSRDDVRVKGKLTSEMCSDSSSNNSAHGGSASRSLSINSYVVSSCDTGSNQSGQELPSDRQSSSINNSCDSNAAGKSDKQSLDNGSSNPVDSNDCGAVKSKSKQSIQDKLLKSIAKDAVSIFSKYIAKDATHPIGVTEEMRTEAIDKICHEDGLVDPHCFTRSQQFAAQIMEERYYDEFMVSDYHFKHQIDLLTTSKVYLADILYNDTAFSYLMQYMEQEGAMQLLHCWLELDNFQQLLVQRQGVYDGTEAQNDAMVIYDKYFSLQATQPLGFQDTVRFEVEANICRESGPLPDCFSKAKHIVVTALQKDYFQNFTQSGIFYKYLQDLINSVQASDVPSVKRSRPSEGDSSSDHSAGAESTRDGTRNTLLATGITKALDRMEDNMEIDNSLLNPDTLWRRPQSGKMSLGKIDELGNFVSEIENDPEGEDKSKLGFFKKKKEKQKSEEEMAAQIAQMIIKDCTVPQVNTG